MGAPLTVLVVYVLAGAAGYVLGAIWREGWPMTATRTRGNEQGMTYRIYPLIGALTLLTVAMFVAMVLSLVQAGVAKQNNAASREQVAAANEQIDQNAAQIDQNEVQADCQQRALEHIVAGLLPRAAFAEQAADIQRVFARRFGVYLEILRTGSRVTPQDVADLTEANQARIKALTELLGSVTAHDLPSLTEIEACRN